MNSSGTFSLQPGFNSIGPVCRHAEDSTYIASIAGNARPFRGTGILRQRKPNLDPEQRPDYSYLSIDLARVLPGTIHLQFS